MFDMRERRTIYIYGREDAAHHAATYPLQEEPEGRGEHKGRDWTGEGGKGNSWRYCQHIHPRSTPKRPDYFADIFQKKLSSLKDLITEF